MIDFDKAPDWAVCLMSLESSGYEYWEGPTKYQKVGALKIFDNTPDTKAITKNWVRIPIVRQLEND